MHYIRFFKSPRLVLNSPAVLSAKITVTTDLGESFLCANVALLVELESEDGKILQSPKPREFAWKGTEGMRSLDISLPIPMSKEKATAGEYVKMLVRPKNAKHAIVSFEDVLSATYVDGDCEGGIVAVRSMSTDIRPSPNRQKKAVGGMAERVFTYGDKQIRIFEETGESIARHIWDAGLTLSAYLTRFTPQLEAAPLPTPLLHKTLSKKGNKILELGAGCGIVGISLATLFHDAIDLILLTDLDEASEILSHNLHTLYSSNSPHARIETQILDWSSPLASPVSDITWSVVVVADCTYNPDVVPDLVKTLRGLGEKSPQVLVLVAMKVRHESEAVFFELMKEGGFVVVERGLVPLPVLGGQGEEIEIWMFKMRKNLIELS